MSPTRQLFIFAPITVKRDEVLDKTIDALRACFWKNAVTFSKFLHTRIARVIGGIGVNNCTTMKSYLLIDADNIIHHTKIRKTILGGRRCTTLMNK